jgi:DnaJ-class molecular chaperone
LMKSDWEECPSCLGSGEKAEAICSKCNHVGWLFVRRGHGGL